MAGHPPSVLIVDDVEANLVALEAQLGGLGCELVRASSGNEALRQLLKRNFALMLLDVQMPGVDGHEVARYARENPATRDVPIIFVTAMHETEDTRLRSYGTGAVDLLFKPIDPAVLRSKVRVFLDLHRGRQRLTEEVAAHEKTLASLERTNEALRHFTYAASHDLHAPLRTMRGFLGALQEDLGAEASPEIRQHLERCMKASARMTTLLDALLAYAGLGKPGTMEEIDCEAVLVQVETDLADRIARCGGRIERGQLPRVRADGGRLYQLFANLLGNALKFSRPDVPPVIRVSAEPGARWTFCVADNGIGIEPTYKTEVFDGFRRLHGQREYEGSGLGLTICREIVRQHGGEIWIESEPGQGTRFYFTWGA